MMITILYNSMTQCITDGVDLEGKEQVEGYSGKKVQQKPSFDVVDSNETRLVDDLSALTHVRRAKVKNYIYSITAFKSHI